MISGENIISYKEILELLYNNPPLILKRKIIIEQFQNYAIPYLIQNNYSVYYINEEFILNNIDTNTFPFSKVIIKDINNELGLECSIYKINEEFDMNFKNNILDDKLNNSSIINLLEIILTIKLYNIYIK